MLMLVSYFLVCVSVLIGLGFLTLGERKVLSYIQLRRGPNKVGFYGVIQPLGDGLKLFMKGNNYPLLGSGFIFLLAPLIMMGVMLLLWSLYFCLSESYDYLLGLIVFLFLSSLSGYGLVFSGWSSGSLYSMVGSYRALAQLISYEVSLGFILLSLVMLHPYYMLSSFSELKMLLIVGFISGGLIWLSSVLCELNRSPFDLAEGESELVSGYNTEYSAFGFSLIFMGEYGSILLSSYLSCMLFFGTCWTWMFFYMVFGVLWVRGSFPRMRYDKVMMMMWKGYLMVILGSFIYVWMVSSIFFWF